MSIPNDVARERLANLMSEAHGAPQPPAVALEVLRLSQEPEPSLEPMVEALGLDPGLASRLLRFANSELYNAGQNVSTLRHASELLGPRSLPQLALGFTLTDALARLGGTQLDRARLWRRSSLRAVAARAIAQRSRALLPEEAFLCGLMYEFGQIVLAQCCSSGFYTVLNNSPEGMPLACLELQVLGFDQHQALDALLEHWGFPSSIRETLRLASRRRDLEESQSHVHSSAAKVLACACMLTDILTLDAPGATLQELEKQARRWLYLGPEAILEILDSLEQGVPQLDWILGHEMPSMSSISKPLLRAREIQSLLARSDNQSQRIGEIVHQELAACGPREAKLEGSAALDYYLERSVQLRLEGATSFGLGLLYLDVSCPPDARDEAPLGALGLELKALVRKSDLWAYLGAGRYGLVMNESSPIALRRAAQRLRGVLSKYQPKDADDVFLRGEPSFGGACIGALGSPEDACTLKTLAGQLADGARAAGRGDCLVHPEQLNTRERAAQAA